MKKLNLFYEAGEAIVRWNKKGMTYDFPKVEVEEALAFCNGDLEHRKIAAQQIAIHCLHGCDRQEMAIVDRRLKEIVEKPFVAQSIKKKSMKIR